MTFELPALPYDRSALEPHISGETLDYHHGKHHQAYVTKLNGLVDGNEWSDHSLEELILQTSGGIFNNAAQVWNHTFYWNSMSPNGGGEPTGDLADAIKATFNSIDEFKQQFKAAGLGQFGSGWAWLVKNSNGTLEIVTTGNACNPMTDGHTPILTCDVWEHAYYVDTRNDRGSYIDNFWKIINWEFASANFANS